MLKKVYICSNHSSYDNGKHYGDTQECVELVKYACKAPQASLWSKGSLVKGDSTISEGTAIATFPNGKYSGHAAIYVSQNDTTSYLFQYDLTAPNITASKDTLSIIASPKLAGGSLRLAPNDKIYWSCVWNNGVSNNYPYADTMYHTENMNLSVINDPNVVGNGCNFSLYSFNLGGKRTYWGLPNNPDYNLGEVVGSVCDSLTNEIDYLALLEDFIIVYPNPFVNELNFQSKYPTRTKLILRNALGQEIFRKTIGEKESINLSSLSDGIYFLELISEKGIQRMKLMKVK